MSQPVQVVSILYTIIPCMLFAIVFSSVVIFVCWRYHKQIIYQASQSAATPLVPVVGKPTYPKVSSALKKKSNKVTYRNGNFVCSPDHSYDLKFAVFSLCKVIFWRSAKLPSTQNNIFQKSKKLGKIVTENERQTWPIAAITRCAIREVQWMLTKGAANQMDRFKFSLLYESLKRLSW